MTPQPPPLPSNTPPGSLTTSSEVIRFFLGDDVKTDDPRSLLGVDTRVTLTDASIVAALQQRLAALTNHPQGTSSQASQVRFLLHSAATKLFEITAANRGTMPSATGPIRNVPTRNGQADQRFIAELQSVIVSCGGWNASSMQRASTIAAMHQKDMNDVTAALASIMQSFDTAQDTSRAVGASASSGLGVLGMAERSTTSPPRMNAGFASVMDPPQEFSTNREPVSASGSSQRSVSMHESVEDDPAKRMIKGVALALATIFVGLIAVAAVIIISSRSQPQAANNPVATNAAGNVPSPPTPTVTNSSGNTTTTQPPSNTPTPPSQVATTPSANSPVPNTAQDQADSKVNAQGRVLEWPDVVASMEATSEAFRSKAPGGGDRFRATYRNLATQWTSVREDARAAGVNAVLEALFIAITDSDQISTVLATFDANMPALAATTQSGPVNGVPEDVDAAVFTAGILSRLSSTRDVPASARTQLTLLSKSFFGDNGSPQESSFEAGAGRALAVIAGWLTSMPSTAQRDAVDARNKLWEAWLRSAKAVRGEESDFFVRSALGALDLMITAGPEPTQNQALYDSMSMVMVALPWRSNDVTRTWLIRQFDLAQASNSDLHVLTSSLALKSGAPGIDPTMVLPVGANESTRAALRDNYADVWNIASTTTKQEIYSSWLAAVQSELSKSTQARAPMVEGLDALIAARLHYCAALLWAGNSVNLDGTPITVSEAVKSILDDLDIGLTNKYNIAAARAANQTSTLLAAATPWSTAYKNVGTNAPQRIQLLSQFPLTPTMVEAQIVVEEAVRGSNERVQALALSAVKTRYDDPAIVNAMLDSSALMPQTMSNTDLVRVLCPAAAVPIPRHAGWRVGVRRALTERLLELIAGRGELAIADELAVALASAYQSIALINAPSGDVSGNSPASPSEATTSNEANPAGTVTYYGTTSSSPNKAASPEDAASLLISRLFSQAEALVPSGKEPLSLARIAASRLAREKLAVGKVQRFAALQLCIFELYTFIVANEQPRAAAGITQLHIQLIAERESQEHVLGQIRVVEQAILRLWLVRHGAGEIALPTLPANPDTTPPNTPAKSGTGAAS